MNNTSVIDTFLGVFSSYIDSGFGLLGGEIGFLSTTLIVIDVTLAGLFWAWGADEDVLQRLVKKTLYIGVFAFIIGNFAHLANIVFQSFAGLGLKASGGAMSLADFMKPGTIAATGLQAAKPLLDEAGQFSSLWAFFANAALILILLLAWAIVVLAFFVIAIQVFITLIEFKLVTLAGFVLLPFAFFNKTAFMAERVLGHIVSSGIKVLVLAVITGIGTTLFNQFTGAGLGAESPRRSTGRRACGSRLSPKAAAISTLLGVGAEMATNNNDPLVQALRYGTQDTINQTGQQIVRRQLDVAPTLTIRPGYPLRVVVTRDLVIDPLGADR